MIIIGEKLNSSVPKTMEALTSGNTAYFIESIKAQQLGGAQYIDINTALCGEAELEKMIELIGLVREHSTCGICIDSPNPQVVLDAMPHVGDRPVIVNSITLKDRIEELLPLLVKTGCGVICLPIGDETPKDQFERAENAAALIQRLTGAGVAMDHIYIDVLVEAMAFDGSAPRKAIEAIRLIKEQFAEVHTVCGLSNISYGLPGRTQINAAFLAAAVYAGLDSAIMDCTSQPMRAALHAANALSGQDEYCMEYIGFCRGE